VVAHQRGVDHGDPPHRLADRRERPAPVPYTDPRKPFYSHRHTAISYWRNTMRLDGSPAVKEDIERYLSGHAGNGAHAGYGKQWIETLKRAVEMIPDPLL